MESVNRQRNAPHSRDLSPHHMTNLTNAMFIDKITDYLTKYLSELQNNIILGDFNIHINNLASNGVVIFIDTMSILGLDQLVKKCNALCWKYIGSYLY